MRSPTIRSAADALACHHAGVHAPTLDLDVVAVPGVPGRLALTSAPTAAGALESLRTRYGTDVLVSLLPSEELARLGLPDLPDRVAAAGMRHRSFPITDMDVPTDVDGLRDLVHAVRRDLAAGLGVSVHCRAGLGRSGLFAACLLVAGGMNASEATSHVRAQRPGAIETPAQVAFVRRFAATIP